MVPIYGVGRPPGWSGGGGSDPLRCRGSRALPGLYYVYFKVKVFFFSANYYFFKFFFLTCISESYRKESQHIALKGSVPPVEILWGSHFGELYRLPG